MKKVLPLLLLLAACNTKPVASLTGQKMEVEARMATAASQAVKNGREEEALALYEKLYNRGDKSEGTLLNYAQLLRKTGNAPRAMAVLSSYMNSNDAIPMLRNEYAASVIETGHFSKAETILRGVIADEEAQDYHADAQNLLGIALGAQGRHKDAEAAFRTALEGWRGDSTSVMNNLAVCLASQGLFDDSLNTLRKALVQAPSKQEIARNIEMVSALRESVIPKPTALR